MARIELLTPDAEIPPDAATVAARIAQTRGELSRPFQLLLHAPAVADRIAELGHVVRSGSHLADADRELATLATGWSLACAFVWSSHLDAAAAAGVPPDTIEAITEDRPRLGEREATLVAFVQELCSTGGVRDGTFAAVRALLEPRELVELTVTVGYYTMLARVMAAFDACGDAG